MDWESCATGENGRGCEDGCGVAGAPPSFGVQGYHANALRAVAPSLTLFPHPMHLDGAAHNPKVKGAPLPFGALPPLRVSTTLRAPPFGCHARAVPHAGWRVQVASSDRYC